MFEYIEITMNNPVIERVSCYCEKCDHRFVDFIPANDELVRFKTISGAYVFLPTYGKNGYLKLLRRLVDDWDYSKEITPVITKQFENEINKYTPYRVFYSNMISCPQCNDARIRVEKRKTELVDSIVWIKVDSVILENKGA